jgi:hypothetical protein
VLLGGRGPFAPLWVAVCDGALAIGEGPVVVLPKVRSTTVSGSSSSGSSGKVAEGSGGGEQQHHSKHSISSVPHPTMVCPGG